MSDAGTGVCRGTTWWAIIILLASPLACGADATQWVSVRVPAIPVASQTAAPAWTASAGEGALSLAVSRSGDRIAVGRRDTTIVAWTVGREGQPQRLTRTPEKQYSRQTGIIALAFSPDASTLASGGEDGVVALWTGTGGSVRLLRGHTDPVHAVAFATDDIVLSGSGGWFDYTLRRWDIRAGTRRVRDVGTIVEQIVVAPDGTAAAMSAGDVLHLVDPVTLETRSTLPAGSRSGAAGRAAFSGDLRLVVVPSAARALEAYDSATARRLWSHPLDDGVTRVAVCAQGKVAAASSGTADGLVVRFWSREGADAGILRLQSRTSSPAVGIELSAGCSVAVSLHEDGTVHLWRLPAVTEPGSSQAPTTAESAVLLRRYVEEQRVELGKIPLRFDDWRAATMRHLAGKSDTYGELMELALARRAVAAALLRATEDALERHDIAGARRFAAQVHVQFAASNDISNAATTVFASSVNLSTSRLVAVYEVASELAKAIGTLACTHACLEAINAVSMLTDYAVDRAALGEDEATRNAMRSVLRTVILKSIGIDDRMTAKVTHFIGEPSFLYDRVRAALADPAVARALTQAAGRTGMYVSDTALSDLTTSLLAAGDRFADWVAAAAPATPFVIDSARIDHMRWRLDVRGEPEELFLDLERRNDNVWGTVHWGVSTSRFARELVGAIQADGTFRLRGAGCLWTIRAATATNGPIAGVRRCAAGDERITGTVINARVGGEARDSTVDSHQARWETFQAAFREAVHRRDGAAVLSMMSPFFEAPIGFTDHAAVVSALAGSDGQGWRQLEDTIVKGVAEQRMSTDGRPEMFFYNAHPCDGCVYAVVVTFEMDRMGTWRWRGWGFPGD